MKMFSDCSGPCETCKIHFIGGCIAGHGDDDYTYASPEWIAEYTAKYPEPPFRHTISEEEIDMMRKFIYEVARGLARHKEQAVFDILMGKLK